MAQLPAACEVEILTTPRRVSPWEHQCPQAWEGQGFCPTSTANQHLAVLPVKTAEITFGGSGKMHRVEKTPVSLAQMILKEKGILHCCFFSNGCTKSLQAHCSEPLSVPQGRVNGAHSSCNATARTHESSSEDTKAFYVPFMQPKLCFPSLVPAADSKSPQPHKVTSHLKLFLRECCRPPRSTGTYPRYSHPALLYPFPPSQLKKYHLETRDYKLPLPVIPLVCAHTAPNTWDLTGVLSL